MNKLKLKCENWTLFDFAWLFIANITILALSIYTKSTALSIISAMAGITNTILISKKMVTNYIFGLICVSTYAYLAFRAGIYGDFIMNAVYYVPMQFIGAYLWIRNKKKCAETGKNEIKSLTHLQLLKLCCVIAVCIFIGAYLLQIVNDAQPLKDSASTVIAIFATILMVLQYDDQWYLWLVVNCLSVALWVVSYANGVGDFATLLRWILYVLNSLFGLYNWKFKKIE